MVDDIQIDREQEALRLRMDESREALAQKIERLEEKVAETVESATASVAEATASVMETVQNATASVSETVGSVSNAVQGTVDTVRHSVEETVDSVKEAFDLSRQVQHNPWLMLAGAVAIGYVGGTFLQGGSRTSSERSKRNQGRASTFGSTRDSSEPPFVAPSEMRSNGFHSNGAIADAVAPSEASRSTGISWITSMGEAFGPEIVKLQGLAVGTILGSVRDMIIEAVPESIQQSVAEVIDDVTEKLGGKCTQTSLSTTEHVPASAMTSGHRLFEIDR